jgi:hypothetical protein
MDNQVNHDWVAYIEMQTNVTSQTILYFTTHKSNQEQERGSSREIPHAAAAVMATARLHRQSLSRSSQRGTQQSIKPKQ